MREPHKVLYSLSLKIAFPSDQADVRSGRQGQGRQAQCGRVGADAGAGGGPRRQVSEILYSRQKNKSRLFLWF